MVFNENENEKYVINTKNNNINIKIACYLNNKYFKK